MSSRFCRLPGALLLLFVAGCLFPEPWLAPGDKNIDFTVVNGSSETIIVKAMSGQTTVAPGSSTSGGATNVDWVRVEVWVYDGSDWVKDTSHKFYSSGTWTYYG